MNSKIIAIAAVLLVLGGVGGFYLANKTQTGGAYAPSYAVAGDPNYAVGIFTATVSPFTLGGVLTATSSKVISVTLTRGLSYGFKLGNTCTVQLSSATSTNGFSADAQITSLSNQTGTASVTFFNATSTATTISTGTLTLACQNY